MTVWTLVHAARRRWPAMVVGLIATLGLAYLAIGTPGVYFEEVHLIFIAPQTPGVENPFQAGSSSLVSTAGLLSREVDANSVGPLALSSEVTIVDSGLRRGVWARLPNTGGQWASNFNRPELDIQVVGPDPTGVRATMSATIEQIRTKLREGQLAAGSPRDQLVTFGTSPQSPPVLYLRGSSARAAMAALVLGLGLTIATATVWDHWACQRRRGDRHARCTEVGDERTVMPDDHRCRREAPQLPGGLTAGEDVEEQVRANSAIVSSGVPGACTAVIVTYQSQRYIGPLLEALEAERDRVEFDVIVVDNASTDRTVEIVSRFCWVRLVPSGGNIGYAAAVNLGSRLVPAERSLLVLNPDLLPAPGAMSALLEVLRRPGTGVVVPRVENADGTLCPSLRYEPSIGRAFVDGLLGAQTCRLPRGWSVLLWDPDAYENEQSPEWAVGAALLISAECRARVGDWDERYFLYCEETDFLRRARAAGLRITYEPSAVVRHIGAGSGTSDGLYALLTVNSYRYYRWHHPPLPSLLFGAALTVHQLVRIRRSAARLALRALVSRRTRSTLPQATFPTSAEACRG